MERKLIVRLYFVRLDDVEWMELEQIVSKLSASSQKVRRANNLLETDVNGPGSTDKQIVEAYRCPKILPVQPNNGIGTNH